MQVAHFSLLSSFPFFSVGSPSFLAAMLMVLVNHYLAFSFFGENYYPFSEVGYGTFKIMVLVPRLRIRIHLIRIRIQHFRLNTDPDKDPGF
jgi:hypothetical protein